MSTHSSNHSSCCPSKPWYAKKVWWVVAISFLGGIGSRWVPFLTPFHDAFWGYLEVVAAPVALGFVLGGAIDRFVPKEYISKFLSRPRKRTVFIATSLGLLASACSHGILALSMELHKKGASGPAVISFLLASPWANFPVTLLLLGLFGARGFLIIAAALVIALFTGLVLQLLDRWGWIERNPQMASIENSFSVTNDLKHRIQNYQPSFSKVTSDAQAVLRGTVALSEMVLGWILFGVVLASLAQAYVPTHFFQSYLNPGWTGILATLAFATVLEVCSEGTAPLALEIQRQTGAFGNSFVFLNAGVVTDYTEMGAIWTNLGKRTAFWTTAIAIPKILILGYLFNRLI